MNEELGAVIMYRCNICSRHFILFTSELEYTEKEATYLTCNYHGKHKSINVVGRYDNVHQLMKERRAVQL